MKYWWVNHKQTKKHEVGGGFIWSPMTQSNGGKRVAYENMRRTSPGDRIFSYANALISNVGIVKDHCQPFPQPATHRKANENWIKQGWLVPVQWVMLKSPFKPKDHIDDIKNLLADKHAPLLKDGNGSMSMYLSEISAELFHTIMTLTGQPDLFENHQIQMPSTIHEYENQLLPIDGSDVDIDDTERDSTGKARVGQGKYRQNLSAVESYCRFTGVSDPRLLTASHIKPWRCCDTGKERLDGNNGLLLTPTFDRLFDRGLITVSRNGEVKVSSSLDQAVLQQIYNGQETIKNVGSFNDEQAEYLLYHNQYVFIDDIV